MNQIHLNASFQNVSFIYIYDMTLHWPDIILQDKIDVLITFLDKHMERSIFENIGDQQVARGWSFCINCLAACVCICCIYEFTRVIAVSSYPGPQAHLCSWLLSCHLYENTDKAWLLSHSSFIFVHICTLFSPSFSFALIISGPARLQALL